MVIARRYGATVFPDLAFERDRFGIGFLHHMRKRARKHAGLAARVDRDHRRPAPGGGFDGPGQLGDRPGQRSRDQQRQHGCAQYGDQSDGDRALLDRLRRRHDHGIRYRFDDRGPLAADQKGRSQGFATGSPGLSLHDLCEAFRGADRRRQIRKVFPPVGRRTQLRTEFARPVGMNEIVAPGIDHVDAFVRPDRRPDAFERRPHIGRGDDDAERLAVGREDRHRDPYRRHMRALDDTILFVQIDPRDVDFIRCQFDRVAEIRCVAYLLQLRIRHGADGAVRA